MSRTKSILFLTAAIIFAGAAVVHAASGNREWVRVFDPLSALDQQTAAISADTSGSVYITGKTGPSFMTTKYSSSGTRRWTRTFSSPSGRAFANDLVAQGQNVVVTGAANTTGTGLDYKTIKYRSNGARLWMKRYDGPAHTADIAKAVTADSSGNVYVTGGSRRAGRDYDFATIKYGPNGTRQWVRRYDGTGHGRDIANAISVDSSGNVVVTGRSKGTTTGPDYMTIKYNSSGVTQWGRRYNGPDSGTDIAGDLSIDTTGNVFVTGRSEGTSTGLDYATLMYSPGGVQQWVSRYNGQGTGSDRAVGVNLDSTGFAYVTGTSEGTTTGNDYATVKYDTSGAQQWVSRYDGPSGLGDSASALSIDSSNNVFVTGTSNDSTRSRIATLKYNSDGTQQWVRRYIRKLGSFYTGAAIAIDANDGLFVGGNRRRLGNRDSVTLKYER